MGGGREGCREGGVQRERGKEGSVEGREEGGVGGRRKGWGLVEIRGREGWEE